MKTDRIIASPVEISALERFRRINLAAIKAGAKYLWWSRRDMETIRGWLRR